MTEKSVLILEKKEGPWAPFLKKYFDNLPARLLLCHERAGALEAFSRQSPAMVFLEPAFLNLPLVQKLKVRKQTDPKFRVYLIGPAEGEKKEPLFDAVFAAAPLLADFTKKWTETLPLPETVRMLVVDDEEEIAGMVRDYFEGRKSPSFQILCAPDGKKGLDAVLKEKPDLIVLDIKMPVMDGRELYAELRRRKIGVPVVIFFDSISGEELAEIRKYGNPPAVEKGTAASSMPVLMNLAEKMIYFCT